MILLDKIYCSEEQIERANKALRLNGGSDSDYNYPRLLAASSLSSNRKPTLRIKRLSHSGPGINLKLKGASSLGSNSNLQRQLMERQRQIELERINAEKALRLNS